MALDLLTSFAQHLLSQLSLQEALSILYPLVFFVTGMTIYSLFIFKFYKFISRKDIFRLSGEAEPSTLKKAAYALEYLFLFPVIAFVWFAVVSVLLLVLSEVLSIGNIFMISMSTLVTIRITAYHSEDLSRDIAKLIPFALLAVFLLDLTPVTADIPLAIFSQLRSSWEMMAYYFAFLVVLEFVFKIFFHGRTLGKPRGQAN